jgi:predicted ATPase
VIGARFEAELLAALSINPLLDELLSVELIEQVRFTPSAEYAFRHPLIRAVAYESQLKSDRAEWHRRLAAAIQERAPGSVEENASLIAEHLQAAGELHAAYGWHMRAAAWSANRDIFAARVSWERACQIADRLPADDPDQLSMRIGPRTMLCATDQIASQESRGRFAERQGVAGHRHDRAANRAHERWAFA